MSRQTTETKTGIASRYRTLLLAILAALFTFGAPYVTYLANSALKRGIFFSVTGGFVSLIIGLFLIWYLIHIKAIS